MATQDLDALAAQFGGKKAAPSSGSNLDAVAAEFGGQPATPAEPVRLDRKAFNAELMRRIRETDQSPEEIKAWARSIYQPKAENAADLTYGLGPNYEKEIAAVRAQPNVPASIVDVTKDTGTDAGAIARSAEDALLFNYGDELNARARSALGGETYEQALQDERTQRALDAQNRREMQGVGMLAGMVGSAAIPVGPIAGKLIPAAEAALTSRAGQALGNVAARTLATKPGQVATQAVSKAADIAGKTGVVGKGAALGAGYSALSGQGAATSEQEAGERLPADVALGATGGLFLPAVSNLLTKGAGAVVAALSADKGAADALRRSGLDARDIGRRAREYAQEYGRKPSLAEVLTREEAGVFTKVLGGSYKAEEKAAKAAVEAGKTLRDRVSAKLESQTGLGPREVPQLPSEAGTGIAEGIAQTPAIAALSPGGEFQDVLKNAGLRTGEALKRADSFKRLYGKEPTIGDVLNPDELSALENALVAKGKDAGRWGIAIKPVKIERNETPQTLTKKANELGDNAYGQYRNMDVDVSEYGADFEHGILPYLPTDMRKRLTPLVENNKLTLGDLDDMRRTLAGRISNNDPKWDAVADARDTVLNIMGEKLPQSRQAIKRMAAYYQAADGAAVGKALATPPSKTSTMDVVDAVNALSNAKARGVAPATREAIKTQLGNNVGQAYKFVSEMEATENPNFIKQARLALGDDADELFKYATDAKRGVDSLMALAKVPKDRVQEVLDNSQVMFDILARTQNAGGAQFGAMIKRALEDVGVRGRAAERLADNLLDPARRDAALAQIAKAKGVRKLGLANKILIRFAAEVGKENDRMPDESITIEPQTP